jgi:hypothetical protein
MWPPLPFFGNLGFASDECTNIFFQLKGQVNEDVIVYVTFLRILRKMS